MGDKLQLKRQGLSRYVDYEENSDLRGRKDDDGGDECTDKRTKKHGEGHRGEEKERERG
jgi:hypothetical protein